jgi:hypothetical protein
MELALLWSARRRRERIYRSAQCIFASAYTFKKLPLEQGKSVEDVVRGLIRPVLSYAEFLRWFSWHAKAAYRAVAMEALKIQPMGIAEWPMPKLRWGSTLSRIPKTPLEDVFAFNDIRAASISAYYRPMSSETARALSEFRAALVDFDELVPDA